MGLVVPLSLFSSNGLNSPTLENSSPSDPPVVYSVLALSDGRIIIGGEFTKVNGEPRKSLAAFDKRGNLLPAIMNLEYTPDLGFPGRAYEIKAQADGKILVGGNYTAINGIARPSLSRFNSDLTIDTSFNASFISAGVNVNTFAIQPNGNILIGTSSDVIYRCNSSGVKETGTFTDITPIAAYDIALQSTGRFIVGSSTRLFGTSILDTRPILRRFNTNGTLDSSFTPGLTIPNYADTGVVPCIDSIDIQGNDAMIVSGNFTIADTTLITPLIASVNASGNVNEFANRPVLYDGFFEPSTNDICYSHEGKYIVNGINFVPRCINLSDVFGFGNPRPAIGTSVCFLTNNNKTTMTGTGVVLGQEYFIYDYPLANDPSYFRVSTKNVLIDPTATPVNFGTDIPLLTMLINKGHQFNASDVSFLLLGSRYPNTTPSEWNTLPTPLESTYQTGTVYIPFLYSGYSFNTFKLKSTTASSVINLTTLPIFNSICTFMGMSNSNHFFANGKGSRIYKVKQVNGKYIIGGKFRYAFDENNITRSSSGVLQSTDYHGNIVRILTTGLNDNSFRLDLSGPETSVSVWKDRNSIYDMDADASNNTFAGGGFTKDRNKLTKITSTGQFIR